MEFEGKIVEVSPGKLGAGFLKLMLYASRSIRQPNRGTVQGKFVLDP